MSMTFRPLLLAAFCIAASPASAFVAGNGLVVEAEGPATFHIPFRGESGALGFWCAAGDYARHRLRASATDRIWRLSEPPRRSGEGIRFSMTSEGRASSSGLAILGPDDASLSVAMAQQMCEVARPVPAD